MVCQEISDAVDSASSLRGLPVAPGELWTNIGETHPGLFAEIMELSAARFGLFSP
jgi:hypothetical protein